MLRHVVLIPAGGIGSEKVELLAQRGKSPGSFCVPLTMVFASGVYCLCKAPKNKQEDTATWGTNACSKWQDIGQKPQVLPVTKR